MDENKELNTNEPEAEAVDKASFADVNYEEEKEEREELHEEKEKKKIFTPKIIYSLSAILVIIALAWVLVSSFSGVDTGKANAYNNPIGVTKGKYLYHSNFRNDTLYKTEIKGDSVNSEKVTEMSAIFFAQHKGDVYFYDAINGQILKYNDNGSHKVIYEGQSYYQQYIGNYVYFLTPDNTYGGFVRRAPLKGGEAEIVLNVSTNCFGISGNNIVYYDPTINTLCATTIKNAMNCAKEANGEASTSNAIGAVALAERYAQNINVTGKDVYFVDCTGGLNVICHLDMVSGKVEEVNFGTSGTLLNVSGKHMFYVGADSHLYRMNLDGKDIRDLTGNVFKQIAGFGVYGDDIVYYALMPKLNAETMQTEYIPVIGVMSIDGKSTLVIPADDGGNFSSGAEMPEVEIEGTEEEVPENPGETEG